MAKHIVTTDDASGEVVADETVEAEPVNYQMVWMPDSLPLFVGDVENIVEIAQSLGFEMFYVLAHTKDKTVAKPTNGPTTTTYGKPYPKVFKVITNMLFNAVVDIEDYDMGLERLEEQAYFELTKIPYELLTKIDAFFFAIDADLKTESIVVLTYDTRYKEAEDPANGWGIVVPEQTNTAGSCKYDPASVLDSIPDEDQEFVRIVGTAHSHPHMSAFASHTDHNDQFGNDGIHITTGWKSGGAVEHYIEMQVGGSRFVLAEEQVFADVPPPPTFPELDEWKKKVSKAAATTTHYPVGMMGGGGYQQAWNDWDPTKTSTSSGVANKGGRGYGQQARQRFDVPQSCPNPRENTVIAELLDDIEHTCPVCKVDIGADERERRRCFNCMCFLALPEESVEDIIKVRKGRNDSPVKELEEPTKQVVIWKRWMSNQVLTTNTVVVKESEGK